MLFRSPLVGLDDLAQWNRHTTAGFEYQRLPGGHFYLDQHERAVFDTIRKGSPDDRVPCSALP